MTIQSKNDSTTSPAAQAIPESMTRRMRPSRRPKNARKTPADSAEAVLVGVYVRVSMAREEMISPELQHRDIEAFLRREEARTGEAWRVVATEEDLDISGRSFAREGIQRLMTLMREGVINKIVTYRYDRFGRNLSEALRHLDEVEAVGGEVISVTEPIDATNAIGNYMRGQTLAMAELQSRQIGDGWKRVHAHRIAHGLPSSGQHRYGYLTHRTTMQRSDGAWRMCAQGCEAGACTTGFVPDPETADVVRWIYEAYVGGKGFQSIAHELNSRNVPTPGEVRARMSGDADRMAAAATMRWTAGKVIDVVDTGFSAGLLTHNAEWLPGGHEPLISHDLWQAYLKRRESQRIVPTKARSARWSLSGLAVCGSCGGPMHCTTSPRGDQYALYCGTARISRICNGSYRTRAAVEGAVFLWLQQYATELESATRDALKDMPVRHTDPDRAERNRLRRLIGGAEGKQARLLDAYADGALELAEFKRRKETLQADMGAAEKRLRELDEPQVEAPSVATVRTFAVTWQTLDPETQRDVAKALLTQVRVMPDKTVEIAPRWSAPVRVRFRKRNAIPDVVAPL